MPYGRDPVWKSHEDELLKLGIMKYGLNEWQRIASLFHRKSWQDCKSRWENYLSPSVKLTPWSQAEDKRLLDLSKAFPSQWATISKYVDRTPAQCVQRFEELIAAATGRALPRGNISFHPAAQPPTAGRQLAEGGSKEGAAAGEGAGLQEDERSMLVAAKARLVNTFGRKQKRTARDQAVEAARRAMEVERRRQLADAGVAVDEGARVGTRARDQRRAGRGGVDVRLEVPMALSAPTVGGAAVADDFEADAAAAAAAGGGRSSVAFGDGIVRSADAFDAVGRREADMRAKDKKRAAASWGDGSGAGGSAGGRGGRGGAKQKVSAVGADLRAQREKAAGDDVARAALEAAMGDAEMGAGVAGGESAGGGNGTDGAAVDGGEGDGVGVSRQGRVASGDGGASAAAGAGALLEGEFGGDVGVARGEGGRGGSVDFDGAVGGLGREPLRSGGGGGGGGDDMGVFSADALADAFESEFGVGGGDGESGGGGEGVVGKAGGGQTQGAESRTEGSEKTRGACGVGSGHAVEGAGVQSPSAEARWDEGEDLSQRAPSQEEVDAFANEFVARQQLLAECVTHLVGVKVARGLAIRGGKQGGSGTVSEDAKALAAVGGLLRMSEEGTSGESSEVVSGLDAVASKLAAQWMCVC